MSRQQLKDLDVGDKIGGGGQGSIHLVGNRPGKALKIYHHPDSPDFRPQALDELVEHGPKLRASGLEVSRWAAWPEIVVADSNRTVGYLMPLLEERFVLQVHEKPHPALLSFLLRPAAAAWEGTVELPDQASRCTILAHLAGILQTVHHRGLVIGDLSYGNAVWARTGHPRAFLLDCDSIRVIGREPVFPQMDTLDWNDPLGDPASAPDQDRDNYKLALAVLRTLVQRTDARPEVGESEEVPGLADKFSVPIGKLLRRAAGARGTRPTAQEWRTALEGRTSSDVPVVVSAAAQSNRAAWSSAPAGKDDILYDPNRARTTRPIERKDSGS